MMILYFLVKELLIFSYRSNLKNLSYILEKIVVKFSNLSIDDDYYLNQRSDLKSNVKNPTKHFLKNGWKENLHPNPYFDTFYYKVMNPNVTINPFIHYILFGDHDYKKPNQWFSNEFYSKVYKVKPFEFYTTLGHYLKHGIKSDKYPATIFYNSLSKKYIDLDYTFLEVDIDHRNYLKDLLDNKDLKRFIKEFKKLYVTNSFYKKEGEIFKEFGCYKLESLKDNGETLVNTKNEFINIHGYIKGVDYPEGYIKHLSNVRVVGGTRIITQEDKIYHDEMDKFRSDDYGIKAWNYVDYLDKKNTRYCILKNITYKKTNRIKKGILISCDHDKNYFHWMVESIEMVLYVLEHIELYPDFPLLVPEGLNKNFRDALKEVIGKRNIEVYELDEGTIYSIEDLIVPSDFSRILDRYHGDLDKKADYALNPMYISKIRNQFLIKSDKKPYRKLYLTRRSGTYRKLFNENEIEKYLLNQGFEVIDLSNVSFEYQRILFSQANLVIAPTGATMTNLLLTPSQSTFIVLYSNHELLDEQTLNGKDVGLWNQLADICEVNLLSLNGKRLHVREDLHDDFVLSVESIENIIKTVRVD